jgi:uncharacterized protein (TIGR00369 family)
MSRRDQIGQLSAESLDRFFKETEPLYRMLNIKLLKISPGRAEVSAEVPKDFFRMGGVVQGGALAAIMDYTGGLTGLTVNEGADQVTQELKINYLRPASKLPLTCKGEVLKSGKRAIVIRMDLFDADGMLCDTGLGTWYVLDQTIGPSRSSA